jgi:hypothetical protein
MNPINIPWPCLQTSSSPPIAQNQNPPPPEKPKSFAQVLNNVCDIPISQLPQSCLKGDRVALTIPEEEYEAGIAACKNTLHGRIIWPKGTTPLKIDALRSKLASLWKSIGKWGVTSLGKGYFEFSFSSLEDMQSVRTLGSWNLSPGYLKLFAWTHDFNPSMQQQSNAQVWIRIYGLAQEYWRPKFFFAIAGSIGTPICTDSASNKPKFDRDFGHFVRVLVDLDLKKPPVYKILVERIDFAFFVEIEYESLPDFCSFCNCIGHDVKVCKRAKLHQTHVDLEQPVKKIVRQEARPAYTRKEQNKGPEVIIVDGSSPKANLSIHDVPNKQVPELIVESSGVKSQGAPITEPVPISPSSTEYSAETEVVEETQFRDSPRMIKENPQSKTDGETALASAVFLKQSWANMADFETRLEAVINAAGAEEQPEVVEQPFQVVSYKKKGKKIKSLNHNHGTRSMVGQSNPLP